VLCSDRSWPYLGFGRVFGSGSLLHTLHLDMMPLHCLAQALVMLGVQGCWVEVHLLPNLSFTLQCRHGSALTVHRRPFTNLRDLSRQVISFACSTQWVGKSPFKVPSCNWHCIVTMQVACTHSSGKGVKTTAADGKQCIIRQIE